MCILTRDIRRLAALVILSLGCRDERPAAIIVDSDPFLFNGPGPVQIPARVVSATGQTMPDVRLRAMSSAEAVATVNGGTLRCAREGDARVDVGVGALTASFVVQCRPVAGFGPFTSVEFEAGGSPEPIPVVAYSANVLRRTHLRFSATSTDTTVAIVRDGRIVPRALGSTRLVLDFGGLKTEGEINVVVTERADTLVLGAKESRQWPLSKGRYRISTNALDVGAEATDIELRGVGANCARGNQVRATIFCVVADSALVVVRASRRLAAILRIVRLPD